MSCNTAHDRAATFTPIKPPFAKLGDSLAHTGSTLHVFHAWTHVVQHIHGASSFLRVSQILKHLSVPLQSCSELSIFFFQLNEGPLHLFIELYQILLWVLSPVAERFPHIFELRFQNSILICISHSKVD